MQSKRNLAILVINYSGRGGGGEAGRRGGGEAGRRGGGEAGRRWGLEDIGGSHGFHGEQKGNQSSPTSMKRQST